MNKNKKLDNQAKENEIRIGMFLLEYNIALSTADHLVDLIKTMDPASKVLPKMKCGRTKATAIVQNVIGEYSFS